jgi:hypothetical protein
MRVEPVRPDPAAPPECAIDGPGDANGETLDPAREARLLVRLHHQVQMVRLNAEMKNAERRP